MDRFWGGSGGSGGGVTALVLGLMSAGLAFAPGCRHGNGESAAAVSGAPPAVVETVQRTGPGFPPAVDGRAAYGVEWTPLFAGAGLRGWQMTDFGGSPDEVRVEEGRLILDFGAAHLSGVTWLGPLPLSDYELTVEAMRVDGSDFFCGLTFPAGGSCCSLIIGGWGGSLVGISSLDGLDASENETTTTRTFENGRWYRVRVVVRSDRIRAWIDDESVVDVGIAGRRVSVRFEVEPSQPLGIAAWQTKAAIRDVRLRLLPAAGDDS